MTKRQALGQHFLRDGAIAHEIVDLVAPTERDLVVEIGPGEGALTSILAGRAGRVVALEIDRALGGALRARLPAVEVLDADARTWDYTSLAAPAGGRVLIVGNLPYSVGKPILMALIGARAAIHEMALMLQREVAERVAAPPGGKTYGSLSVFTQLHCDVRVALRVPPGAFRPPPKVESAVLHLRMLREPRVRLADARRFETVVRAAFAQRRKMLANALGAGLGLPLDVVRRAATGAGVDPARRAETLTLVEFAELTARLEATRAAYRETVAGYVNQVLIAYGDVEDALTDLRATSDEVQNLRRAVTASREYLRLANVLYKQGLVDYLIVIDAERTLLANEVSLAQMVNLQMAASIRLIKALGGGWNPAEVTASKVARPE